MIDFLSKYFYYPDAILACAEFFKIKGDFKNLMPLIERGIYVFEYCLSPEYNPLANTPNTLLDFGKPLNFLFGRFIFNYIDMLSHQGCIKTALEYCKYLLSCDPFTDPFGMLLLIDYLTNRTKNPEFLENLIKSLHLLELDIVNVPSIIYGVALSKKKQDEPIIDNAKIQERVGMILSTKDSANLSSLDANCLLICAIVLYPDFVEVIVKKKGEKVKVDNLPHFEGYQSKQFTDIIKHPFITQALKYTWHDEHTYLKCKTIFEEKGSQCFDNCLQWIKNITGHLMNNEATTASIREHLQTIIKHPVDFKRYQQINTVDFMEDLKTLTADQINLRMEENTFNRFQHGENGNAPHPIQNPNMNPLLLLLNTLLPWNNIH